VSRVRENRTHGSTGGDWKRNATASPRQPPTQPSSELMAREYIAVSTGTPIDQVAINWRRGTRRNPPTPAAPSANTAAKAAIFAEHPVYPRSFEAKMQPGR
jgi:hypothetical protein